MKSIEQINNAKKTIVFPELSIAEVNAYINDVLKISKVDNYEIIVSDSIYNSMNSTLTSEVYIYDNQDLYKHSLLKKFYGFIELDQRYIKIPDSIAFSQATTLINSNYYYFLTDSKFAKYVFVEKSGMNEITVLNASDITFQENFTIISGDTMCYYLFDKYRNILNDANMDVMRLNHTFCKNMMASFIMAPNVVIREDEAGLSYISGIIIFENPNDYSIFRINEDSLPEGYFVFPGFYYQYDGLIYLQLSPLDKTIDDQYLLGMFYLEETEIVFKEFTNFKLPNEYLPAKKFKSLRKILTPAEPYIFLQYSLSYYNMDNDSTYQLPMDPVSLNFEMPGQSMNLMKFEYNFKFIDAFISNNVMQILYEKSNKYYVAVVDIANNELIKNDELIGIAENVKAGLTFFSEDVILYLSNDNAIVKERIKLN